MHRPYSVSPTFALTGLFAATILGGAAAQSNPVAKKLACERIAREYDTARKPVEGRKLNHFLFDASHHGCDTLAQSYLDLGASIKTRDRFGNTALSVASRMGHRSMVAALIERGSDANHRNLAGSSVLLRAVTQRRRPVIRLLLKNGADPSTANLRGVTPLIAASFNGDRRLVGVLLAAGADPVHQDGTGKGAIVYAAGRGFTNVVKLFLDTGLDSNRAYGNDLTALMWAAGHSNDVPEVDGLATVRLLLAHNVNVDAADNRGRTALMIAAERGHAKIAASLLQAGATHTTRDRQGKTALDLAANDAVRTILAR